MKLTALSLLLMAVLCFSVSQTMAQQSATSDEVTKENWQQHPKINAVRAIVETVKDGLNRKSFRTGTRKFEYCEPYEDGQRTLAIDRRGRVRYYEKQGGSEDSSLKWEHYYDDLGRLRFVFITGGATNGAELEHRIYFDEGGKRIYEEQKYTKGEGYTFPTVWPAEQLNVSNVSAAFAAKSSCPEIKSKKAKGQARKGKR
ncbi:MAG TPA: hypothetical protein VEQ40_11885 [Pyrinomonadaceae bacterium]|nr:hypothetical protein [Pyrinomonadaceae bacterium]